MNIDKKKIWLLNKVLSLGLIVFGIYIYVDPYWQEASALQDRADAIGWNVKVELFDYDDVAEEIEMWEAQFLQIKVLEKRAKAINWPLYLGGPPYYPEKLDEIADRVRYSEELYPRVLALQKRAKDIGVEVPIIGGHRASARHSGPKIIKVPYREDSLNKTEAYVVEMEELYQRAIALKKNYGLDLLKTRQLTSIKDDLQEIEQWHKDGLDLSRFDFYSVEIEHWLEIRGMFEEIKIPAGSFMMGCDEKRDKNCTLDQLSAHKVTLSRPFYMMKTEVTQMLYQEVMGGNPTTDLDENQNKEDFINPSFPVTNIEWIDAIDFANQLSQLYGLEECYEIHDEVGTYQVKWSKKLSCQGWRLPTEAEWEYAARAPALHSQGARAKDLKYAAKEGEDYTYPGSNDCEEIAWANCTNVDRKTLEKKGYPWKGLHYPCEKKSNDFGLCDMAGNVQEWVWDIYEEDSEKRSSVTDPLGPEETVSGPRILKGGAWQSQSSSLVPSSRVIHQKDETGLRLVRSAE